MADRACTKRQREETYPMEEEENYEEHQFKRQNSDNQIVSFLEEEEESNEDISSLITTLQKELASSDPKFDQKSLSSSDSMQNDQQTHSIKIPSSISEDSKFSTADEKERIMRHLLEASDDELGIPSGEIFIADGVFGDEFPSHDALWELEDEAANYYTLLQCELFM